MNGETFGSADVEAAFAGYPEDRRERLLGVRQLILDTAAENVGVGRIEETLKWGQVSYLTPETKSGTTIRIDAEGDGIALFVNCQTDLIERYRSAYPTSFGYGGNRAVLLEDGKPLDAAALKHCIAMALTYHKTKRPK
jgi:hypothetical protein